MSFPRTRGPLSLRIWERRIRRLYNAVRGGIGGGPCTKPFFNDKRELGDWYRGSLEEVKSDLSAFIFKGTCRDEQGPVQLPTVESTAAVRSARVHL